MERFGWLSDGIKAFSVGAVRFRSSAVQLCRINPILSTAVSKTTLQHGEEASLRRIQLCGLVRKAHARQHGQLYQRACC